MKKIITISAIAVILLTGGGLFLWAQHSQTLPSQADIGNSVDPIALDSFRGILTADYEKPANMEKQELSGSSPVDNIAEDPVAGSTDASELTFAVLGDTQSFEAGNAEGNFQKVVSQIKEHDPDLAISVGDLISNCEGNNESREKYSDWKNTLGSLASKSYAVQGNHDRSGDGSDCDKIWQEAFNFPTNGPSGFSELAFSLDFQNSHFVFLDSEKPEEHIVNSTQRKWLETDLTNTRKENIFAVFHEPAYPVSDKREDSLDADPSQRNALWEILDRHKVTAVFSGHEHITSRRKITDQVSSVAKNSIYQFVFGNTDSFNHDLPAAGVAEYAAQGQGKYGLVKVKGKEITVETYDADEGLLDTFTFSK